MTWISTYSGRKFDFKNMRPEDVSLEDICHSLAMIPRFNGHTLRHYSVAEHSINVGNLMPREEALHGLLHDAAEAYIGDWCTPLKQDINEHSIDHLRILERHAIMVIYEALKVKYPSREVLQNVKYADRLATITEAKALMPHAEVLEWGWPDAEELLKDRRLKIATQQISHSAMADRLHTSIDALK